jgi:hypothetical protein
MTTLIRRELFRVTCLISARHGQSIPRRSHKISLRFTVINIDEQSRPLQFSFNFSGTHFVTPRTLQVQGGNQVLVESGFGEPTVREDRASSTGLLTARFLYAYPEIEFTILYTYNEVIDTFGDHY